ncbi:hypothetical protein HPB48_019143 [Haemaphysalis longicornis]|uniref:Uncharacterized protein n=1 Tax=Haemaphysalis longicornis TaxID=44386 RepID=A0A9J6GJR5_HAELO|nr:hypothetical protein HPB48_019143 [Haemaphysalis longicornis]
MTEQSYRDWNVNPYFNCSLVNPSAERCSVPPSCCRTVDEEGLDDYADPHSGFSPGSASREGH